MKILAFTPYGSMIGGANRSFLMVLGGLKNTYHHEIHVVVPQEGKLTEELSKEGISYRVAPSHTLSGIKSLSPINLFRLLRYEVRAAADKKTAKALAKEFADESFDIVYINDTDNYLGALVALEMGLPYVWHFRSLVPSNMRFIASGRKIYGSCSRIITISERMKSLLVKNKTMPADRVTMIHNGIPVPENLPMSDQSTQNGFHFVLCGRITPDKGHTDAIRAIALLSERGYNDIYLHIAGSTPSGDVTEYLTALKTEISALNIEDRIIFEGLVDNMADFRTRMNGELMCSVCEPFGRVTLEGMRSGLVVIGSNTGGTPEIINDGITGLLYEQGSHTDLADKIERVYKNEAERSAIIANAIDYSRTHFTADTNVSEVNAVIAEAHKEFKKQNGIG